MSFIFFYSRTSFILSLTLFVLSDSMCVSDFILSLSREEETENSHLFNLHAQLIELYCATRIIDRKF